GPGGPRGPLAGAAWRPPGLCPCGRFVQAGVICSRSERCPSGLRSATGNRVRAERSVAGSNPALSASPRLEGVHAADRGEERFRLAANPSRALLVARGDQSVGQVELERGAIEQIAESAVPA